MVQCSDGSEEDKSARARWSKKASWRRRTFTLTLVDGETECGREEVLLAKMVKASHEWRQEGTRWYWKEIM